MVKSSKDELWRGTLDGTPKKAEDDPQRHETWCKYYQNGYCSRKVMDCTGSKNCDEYLLPGEQKYDEVYEHDRKVKVIELDTSEKIYLIDGDDAGAIYLCGKGKLWRVLDNLKARDWFDVDKVDFKINDIYWEEIKSDKNSDNKEYEEDNNGENKTELDIETGFSEEEKKPIHLWEYSSDKVCEVYVSDKKIKLLCEDYILKVPENLAPIIEDKLYEGVIGDIINIGGKRYQIYAVEKVNAIQQTIGSKCFDSQKYYRKSGETIQNYVKRLLKELDKDGLISDSLIEQLQNIEYCKQVFGIQYSLLEKDRRRIRDNTGHLRYWVDREFRSFYVCSQWWKQDDSIYERKLHNWVNNVISKYNK